MDSRRSSLALPTLKYGQRGSEETLSEDMEAERRESLTDEGGEQTSGSEKSQPLYSQESTKKDSLASVHFLDEDSMEEKMMMIREVSRLLRERQKIVRLHRKAERQVMLALERRQEEGEKTSDIGVNFDEEAEVKERSEEDITADWETKAASARETLQKADQEAEAEELKFRLMMEEEKSKTCEASAMAIENLISRQGEADAKVEKARLHLFDLHLKKQQVEEQVQQKEHSAGEQIHTSKILQTLTDTEALTEEALFQKTSISKLCDGLKVLQNRGAKLSKINYDLCNQLLETTQRIDNLQSNLQQLHNELQQVAVEGELSRKRSEKLLPAFHLALDPVLAKDYREKQKKKIDLEDELRQLRLSFNKRNSH